MRAQFSLHLDRLPKDGKKPLWHVICENGSAILRSSSGIAAIRRLYKLHPELGKWETFSLMSSTTIFIL